MNRPSPRAPASFRFYAELNDHLPPRQRCVTFACAVDGRTTVKEFIRRMGVPEREVDLVLANGEPVDFTCKVAPGDRIAVYPVFESLDISAVSRLRAKPLRRSRFIVDAPLRGLARRLRLLGFDCVHGANRGSGRSSGAPQPRVLLTLDARRLEREDLTHAYLLQARRPWAQAREVLARLDLYRAVRPLGRCLDCNAALPGGGAPAPRCPVCGRSGRHARLLRRAAAALGSPADPGGEPALPSGV